MQKKNARETGDLTAFSKHWKLLIFGIKVKGSGAARVFRPAG
jgi:hypothetical protein